MKTLILVRHAKSNWDNPALSDFDRPLNDRGKKDAPRMGKRLKEKDLTPDVIISSPANRALTTCYMIAEIIGFPVASIKTDRSLYHASEDDLLEVVHNLTETSDLVMLFGHNPGLTDFANSLTHSRIDNIPTCGIVSCTFKVDRWKDILWGKGKVNFFDYPKRKQD